MPKVAHYAIGAKQKRMIAADEQLLARVSYVIFPTIPSNTSVLRVFCVKVQFMKDFHVYQRSCKKFLQNVFAQLRLRSRPIFPVLLLVRNEQLQALFE